MSTHRFARKLERYAEVRLILAAMKNTALIETYKLGGRIERQERMLETVARMAADFAAFHPLRTSSESVICIVIGSERGFCGEFNAELVPPLRAAQARGEKVLVVGSRLAERLEDGDPCDAVPGATVAEEILTVLERVAVWLERAESRLPGSAAHIKVLYQDESAGKPILKTVAPLPEPKRHDAVPGHPPYLTLSPPELMEAMGEQALLLSLEGCFTLSLATENQRRLEHMHSALTRLDEMTTILKRRLNAARQAEIIQEIETIMLGSGS